MKPFRIQIKDFSGGLNLKYDDSLMAINEARDLQNCDPYSKGWLDRRKGCTKLTSDGVSTELSIDNMIRFYPSESTKILVCTTNNATANKVWSIDDTTGEETEITGGTALTANTRIRFAIFSGYLFLSDGTAPIQYWNGTGTKADIIGDPVAAPTGKYMAIHKRRMFVAGNSTNPANLYYSDLDLYATDPGTDCDFPAANDEPIGDGTLPIMGIIPQQDHLVIFKENTIHKWIGTADYEFRVQDTNRPYGCIAPDSISMCEGWVVFLSNDGVRAYDGGLHCVLLSDKISPIFDGSSTKYGISAAYKKNAYGIYHDGLYHLFYNGGNSTYKNRELIFNFRRWLESNGQVYSWYYNEGRNLSCACSYLRGTDENELKLGDSNAAYIYNAETGYNDAVYGCVSGGNIIDSYWKSKKIDAFEGADAHDIKKFRKLKANTYIQAGSLEFYFDVDNQRLGSTTIAVSSTTHAWGDGRYWGDGTYWTNSVLRNVNEGLSTSYVGKNISILIREKSARSMARVHNVELFGKAKPYK